MENLLQIEQQIEKNKSRLEVFRMILVEVLGNDIGSSIKFEIVNQKEGVTGRKINFIKIKERSSVKFSILSKKTEINNIFLQKFGEEVILK